jgi:hypothetical protein
LVTIGGNLKNKNKPAVNLQPEAACLGSLKVIPNRAARAILGEVGKQRENKVI